MLRISAGTAKNKKLQVPEIEGMRPVQEIAKNAIFSIIGEKVENAVCLDLFAGSGNLGIEALSRGAEFVDFVDENGKCISTIKENLENCGFPEETKHPEKNLEGARVGQYWGNEDEAIARYLGTKQEETDKTPSARAKTHRMEAAKFVVNADKKYDLIFVDPFYKDQSHKYLLKNLGNVLKTEGMVFFLHDPKTNLTDLMKDSNLKIARNRRFGKSMFSILQHIDNVES